jgi:hypothetical protein
MVFPGRVAPRFNLASVWPTGVGEPLALNAAGAPGQARFAEFVREGLLVRADLPVSGEEALAERRQTEPMIDEAGGADNRPQAEG